MWRPCHSTGCLGGAHSSKLGAPAVDYPSLPLHPWLITTWGLTGSSEVGRNNSSETKPAPLRNNSSKISLQPLC